MYVAQFLHDTGRGHPVPLDAGRVVEVYPGLTLDQARAKARATARARGFSYFRMAAFSDAAYTAV